MRVWEWALLRRLVVPPYARLLEEKKKTYAEYRRSREEMRELLVAKANVDRLMGMEEERLKDKDKDQEKNR